MCKVLTFIVAILAVFMLILGCCHGISNSTQVTQNLPNPNDFVKSTVMLTVAGTVTIESLGEEKKK